MAVPELDPIFQTTLLSRFGVLAYISFKPVSLLTLADSIFEISKSFRSTLIESPIILLRLAKTSPILLLGAERPTKAEKSSQYDIMSLYCAGGSCKENHGRQGSTEDSLRLPDICEPDLLVNNPSQCMT